MPKKKAKKTKEEQLLPRYKIRAHLTQKDGEEFKTPEFLIEDREDVSLKSVRGPINLPQGADVVYDPEKCQAWIECDEIGGPGGAPYSHAINLYKRVVANGETGKPFIIVTNHEEKSRVYAYKAKAIGPSRFGFNKSQARGVIWLETNEVEVD